MRGNEKTRRLVLFGLSAAGWFVVAGMLWWTLGSGIDFMDAKIWDRAGDQVRAGLVPYQSVAENPVDSFWYAPPIAVLFAVVSWIPVGLLWLALVVVDTLALRYVVGSWRNVGIAGLFPLTTWEVLSGNFNFVIAAGLVMAVRGRPELAVLTSFAKLSPVLAVHPRDWRRAALTAAVLLAVSLPGWWLWEPYLRELIAAYGQPLGYGRVPVPFAVRAAIAVGLLLLWRPWSRTLAAIIAVPSMYWSTLVMLVAPLVLGHAFVRRVEVAPAHRTGSTMISRLANDD